VPGFSIHRELRFLVLAGLTPYEALVTGTRNVATFLGRPAGDGTVGAGARADLVLVHGNPLEDIGNTTRIAGVMIGGRWLPREAIDGRLRQYVVAR
jgi:imidazolonepropionase-like amidohydrolase